MLILNYYLENISILYIIIYSYKFYVDNEWVCSDDDLKDNDIYGNINNFIII